MSWVRDLYHRAIQRLGWRGDVLLTFAFVDAFYGWSLFQASGGTIDTNPTYRWACTIAPLWLWASLWWLAAAVCAFYALQGQTEDRIGFEAAIGIKMLWASVCLVGVIMSDVSIGSVAIWLGFARLVWRISVWTEPRPSGDDAS